MGVSKGGGGSRKGPSKGGARMGGGPGDRDLHFSKAQKSRGGKTKAGKGVGWLRDPRWATSEDMSKTNKQLREERAKDTKKSGSVKTYSAKERAELQRQMFGGDKKKGRKATQSSDASKTPGETKAKKTGPAKGSSKASKAAATRAKNKAAAAKKGRGPKTVEARREASRRAGKASKRRAGGSAPMKPATTRIGGGPYRPKSIGATLKDILE